MLHDILMPPFAGATDPEWRVPVTNGAEFGPGDAALLAVTDFRHEPAFTIEADAQIDAALADMIHRGVRALLVNRTGRLAGLVTAYDIQGERPGRFLQDPACEHVPCRRRDIRVRDIMTPLRDLPVLDWTVLLEQRIEDLRRAFATTGLYHLLVVERTGTHGIVVRGIASRTRLERGLGGIP